MKFLNTRYLGVLIVIISVVTAFTTFSLSSRMLKLIDESGAGSCQSVGTCPHVTVINYSYIFYTISLALFIIGTLIVFFENKPEAIEPRKNEWDENAGKLEGEEKIIYEIIKNSDGVIFQSQLVKKSNLTKVKVSRILDSLETKGLLERRRRGMSNAVVLK